MKLKSRPFVRPLDIAQVEWHHEGMLHRVRLSGGDEVVVWERQTEEGWEPFDPDPSSETFESAALALTDEVWIGFVRSLPAGWQDYLRYFRYERLEALAVLSRCPALLPHVERVPALTVFLATHAELRGTEGARWDEINAVYDRGNIYAVLEWLGLPATPHTLAILADEPDPELPRGQLDHIRAALWETSHHPLAA